MQNWEKQVSKFSLMLEIISLLTALRLKPLVWATIIHKIFEINSSFYVKWRTKGKVLFLKNFFLVFTKFLFRQGDWALGYYSMEF